MIDPLQYADDLRIVADWFDDPAVKATFPGAPNPGARLYEIATWLEDATPQERQARQATVRRRCKSRQTRILPHNARLTVEQVREIRARHYDGDTLKAIAADYPVGLSSVCRIANRQSYRNVT